MKISFICVKGNREELSPKELLGPLVLTLPPQIGRIPSPLRSENIIGFLWT